MLYCNWYGAEGLWYNFLG